MSEMVNRVAKSIADVEETHDATGKRMGDALARELARAAIEAMREPTEAMKTAGSDVCVTITTDTQAQLYENSASDVFTAMLDKALE